MHCRPPGYSHCRSGSDSGLHRAHGGSQRRHHLDAFDSGDSTLSDLDESESGSGVEVDPNLPYPGIAPITLGYLTQTSTPRSWCLAMVSSPSTSKVAGDITPTVKRGYLVLFWRSEKTTNYFHKLIHRNMATVCNLYLWFERVSIIVILMNCITLGMYQPCVDDECETNRCKILQVFDDFIFAFFALEMSIKMVAMGVYGRGTYLADCWNVLDLVIVVAGAVEYSLNVDNLNLSAIRTIRVLRPLRAINRIPSMRILVMLLLDTLPMLGNVLMLCFFVFFIFGIIGVQLWHGILRQRCVIDPELAPKMIIPQDTLYYKIPDSEYICSKPDAGGMHSCLVPKPPFRNGSRACNLTYEEAQLYAFTNESLCINWNIYYNVCKETPDNPFQGTISFDNIGLAWVSIFLVISLEGWTDIMYYVQDAHSFWDWIYFVLLIVIGSFFMINLCLVVIATQFSETKKREMERMRLERARFQSSSTLASSTNNSEPNSCYAEIVKYIAHLWRRGKRKLLKRIRLYRVRRDQRRDKKIICGETIRLNYAKKHHPNCLRVRSNQSHSVPSTRPVSRTSSVCLSEAQRDGKGDDVEHFKRPSFLRVPSISNQEIAINNNDSPTNLLSPPCFYNNRRRSSVMFSDIVVLHGETSSPPSSSANLLSSNIDKKNICSSEKTTQTGDGNIWQISPTTTQQNNLQNQQIVQDCCDLLNGEAMTCQELLAIGAINATLPTGQIVFDSFFKSLTKGITGGKGVEEMYVQHVPEEDFSCCHDLWHCESEYKNETRGRFYIVTCLIIKGFIKFLRCCKRKIKVLVECKYFQQGILLAILINTSSMGIEYHDQPDWLTQLVEYSNLIFSGIFAVEMLLKIIAEGVFGYISNGFNVFDGIIVILSGIELCQRFMGESHLDSGLSVLRTFRLLRILKLVRFMPNLRRQLFVMLRTMDNVAIFFSLLILFIFIFSILGMYLFGGKFCNYRDENGDLKECTCYMIVTKDKNCVCDRKHFNNILWATVTVFQILTQEDWNMVLSNGMAKTSHWAALYFVALMTFGNYVLFNLLVAILVEGFSSERNERREREQRELARRKMSSMLEASLRDSSDSRSISSSSASGIQEVKNYWKSAEELRKVKDYNEHKSPIGLSYCDCRERVTEKDCCILGFQEPKCNIQKESLLRQPSIRQASPPIITHTAATPQDSPSTTLDDFPEFRYNITPVASDCHSPSESSRGDPSSTDSTQKTSSLSLLKPPSFTPPPITFRQLPITDSVQGDEITPRIVTHNERIGSRTMTYSEKVSVPQQGRVGKERIQRKCSWKLTTRSSLKRKKSRSGSESDAMPLNNGRDHSLCNGKGVTRQASLRNDSLLQSSFRIQNDTQKDTPNNKSAKGLSPQNSIRSRSNTYSSVSQSQGGIALTRRNSIINSSVYAKRNSEQQSKNSSPVISRKSSQPIEIKSINNLNDKVVQERTLPKIKMEDCVSGSNTSDRTTPKVGRIKRFLRFIEPTGYMKERSEYSLYLFPPENKFRQRCKQFVEQKWFDNVVLLFIAMNCITLAMERPNIPSDSTEKLFLTVCNYIFTFVFTAEMFVKVVAAGMCYGPDAYFTSGWNIMDGSLVMISIVDLLMSLFSQSPRIFGILRVFRLLRSLRPLRVINRAPGLKLVVQTLLSSLRPIGNIVLICCTFFIIFGILGVQLFKGSFYHCAAEDLTDIITKEDCIERQYEWVNEKYNFDDLGQALMSLFVLSSRDGWVNIMYRGLDAVGEDLQPITNYSEWRLLYFISFILLVGFFVLNMFVGVVVENFHRCREEQEKEERVRRAAKRALQLEKRRRKMNEPPYYINYSPWRLFIHNIVISKYFELAIAGVIGLNVVTMAVESHRMADILEYILKIFNYFFTTVFIIEGAMKLIALGFRLYMKERWNQLDVAIVLLSVVGIVLEELKSNVIPINPTVLRVMRVMRIARVLKLLKMAKGIRALLDTVMQALPQVGNLGLLFFLLFFIFAALGVELFGRLDCEHHPCQGLGEHAHFENFGMAFLTLFRVATGDNWNGIMKDTLRDEIHCSKDPNCVTNCCVSKIIAPIFFVIFVLMAQFVLVNVVVAVLMKHLEESHKHLEDEQDLDNQIEREIQEKQEMEERRELCLALQVDQEYESQRHRKPLTKVLSLPDNFIYHPPGSKSVLEKRPSLSSQRRMTFQSNQPFLLPNLEDIKHIDESSSDFYSIQEIKSDEREVENNHLQSNQDEIIALNQPGQYLKIPKPEERFPLKRINEDHESNKFLLIPQDSKPVHKMFGSTKHMFVKQKALDITEETPFLQSSTSLLGDNIEMIDDGEDAKHLRIPKHDSQESVQRIITERRNLDETLQEIDAFDIFETSLKGAESNIATKEQRENNETDESAK